MATSSTEATMTNGEQEGPSHLVNGTVTTTTTPTRNSSSSSRATATSSTVTSNSTAPDYTSIAKLFTDRSVFITGGTGFMGKVLVEKLLRSCPGIKNIYLLIRPKKGQETAARLNDLLNTPVSYMDTMNHPVINSLRSPYSCSTRYARSDPTT